MFIDLCRKFFPNSHIQEHCLGFPWSRDTGWPVTLPDRSECRFNEPDYWIILNLQDMLTEDQYGVKELREIHNYFVEFADMRRIIVVAWPLRIKKLWPKNSFHLVEFSTFQYDTWQQYKRNEDILREVYSEKNKRFEYNFVCMSRHDKPHRRIAYSRLRQYGMAANCSLQSQGYELAYPNKSFTDYEQEYNNFSNLISLQDNFNTALFNIISESQYQEMFGIVTEKMFNAAVAGMPFLALAHRKFHQDVETLGFRNYEKIFDLAYDDIDNTKRIDYMIQDNSSHIQKHMHIDDMYDVYDYCREEIEYNRDFFFADFGPQQKSKLQRQLLELWSN